MKYDKIEGPEFKPVLEAIAEGKPTLAAEQVVAIRLALFEKEFPGGTDTDTWNNIYRPIIEKEGRMQKEYQRCLDAKNVLDKLTREAFKRTGPQDLLDGITELDSHGRYIWITGNNGRITDHTTTFPKADSPTDLRECYCVNPKDESSREPLKSIDAATFYLLSDYNPTLIPLEQATDARLPNIQVTFRPDKQETTFCRQFIPCFDWIEIASVTIADPHGEKAEKLYQSGVSSKDKYNLVEEFLSKARPEQVGQGYE